MRNARLAVNIMTFGCQCIWSGMALTMTDLPLARRAIYIVMPNAFMSLINVFSMLINDPE